MKQHIPGNQTQFADEQTVLQTPPEDVPTEEAQPTSLKKKLLVGSLLFFAFLLFLSIVYRAFFYTAPAEEVTIEVTPTPEIVSEPTALEAELSAIEEKLDVAHPDEQLVLPPPVDLSVEF